MVEFSGKQYRYDTQKFLLCASDLPLLGRVEHCPFLSVSIKFQSEDILEALKEIEGQEPRGQTSVARLIYDAVFSRLTKHRAKFYSPM